MSKEIAYLQIKLQHVDIHNHWLHQEIRDGWITVEYVSIKKMIADELTKVLTRFKFNKFLQQISLVNIANWISEHEVKKNQEELDHNALEVYLSDID